MPSRLSDAQANNSLDVRFGGAASTAPATYYAALLTTAPTTNTGTSAVEVAGGAYARVAVTKNATNFPAAAARSIANGVAVTWPTATAAWGTIVGVAFYDAATTLLAAPVITLGAAAAGGTFAAGTYFWKLTAINAAGETLGSNELTAALTLNQQQPINWTAIPGATGYKLYRGTAAGAENVLVATLGAVVTYTDTGTAGTAATVPVANTTSGTFLDYAALTVAKAVASGDTPQLAIGAFTAASSGA